MISPELLDYEPKSVYFKQRWGAALAWAEENNGTVEKETGGDTKEYRTGEHRTTVRTAGKRGGGVGAGERDRSHNVHDLLLVSPTPGL
jgi:hypothetical protein